MKPHRAGEAITVASPDATQHDVPAGPSAFAALPRLDALLQPAADEVIKAAAVVDGQRLLSVGAGPLPLLAARRGAVVTAVDASQALLARRREEARDAGIPVTWSLTRPRSLAFEEATYEASASAFDAMVSRRATRMAAEMFRVTRPGGMVVIAVWEPNEFTLEAAELLAAHRGGDVTDTQPSAGLVLDVLAPHFAALADDFHQRSIPLTLPVDSAAQLLEDLLLPGGPLALANRFMEPGNRQACAAEVFRIARGHGSHFAGSWATALRCRVLSGRRPVT